MAKEEPNKRYTPEFKTMVVETMLSEELGYRATARQFEINGHHRIQAWERIYRPEGFAVERLGRRSKGRLPKRLIGRSATA